MINLAFEGLSSDRNFVYIDDYFSFFRLSAMNEGEMYKNLEEVFERCRSRNLILKAVKCQFFRNEVTYLGHRCTKAGILPV